MPRRLKVLVIPSWYPSEQFPAAGIFIYQQVSALEPLCDVAVLHIQEVAGGVDARVIHNGKTTIVHGGIGRSLTKAVAPRRTLIRRIRAVSAYYYNKFVGYRRVARAAYEQLRSTWGDADIIHVQALFPAAQAARAIQRRHPIPYVVTEHAEDYVATVKRGIFRLPGVMPLVIRPLARRASRTIAVSRFLADRLVALDLARDPVVVPNIVPVHSPEPAHPDPPHVISHVSVMGPAKNFEGLMGAVDSLRGTRDDFVLRLVGDGTCRPQIEALVDSLDLGDFVELAGTMSAQQVREHLATSAFTVISSTYETFSVSAAESLMCGRPVLSTRCGGPEEFITPGVGRLVDAGSADALAHGLDWMLDHYLDFDPQALHAYAVERFAPDAVAHRILGVYEEVLGGADRG